MVFKFRSTLLTKLKTTKYLLYTLENIIFEIYTLVMTL